MRATLSRPARWGWALTVLLLGAASPAVAGDTPAPQPTTTVSFPSSTLQATTSSSVLQDYDNEVLFGVYPSRPLAELTVRIRAHADYGTDDAYCLYYPPDGQKPVHFVGQATIDFRSLPGGVLNRSQGTIICNYYTHEPHGPMSDYSVVVREGKDAAGEAVEVSVCQLRYTTQTLPPLAPGTCRSACGDALCDGGEPKASDSLAILRASIGIGTCALHICDANRDGEVLVTDAQRILRRAVGRDLIILCPGYC